MRKLSISLILFLFLFACSKNKYEAQSGNCDLSESTYNGSIKKIVENNCSYSPCHAASPMDSTLTYDFTSYDKLKRAAGSIYDRINRPVSDPLHMPKNIEKNQPGYELSECDLAQLNTWILNGAPEN